MTTTQRRKLRRSLMRKLLGLVLLVACGGSAPRPPRPTVLVEITCPVTPIVVVKDTMRIREHFYAHNSLVVDIGPSYTSYPETCVVKRIRP